MNLLANLAAHVFFCYIGAFLVYLILGFSGWKFRIVSRPARRPRNGPIDLEADYPYPYPDPFERKVISEETRPILWTPSCDCLFRRYREAILYGTIDGEKIPPANADDDDGPISASMVAGPSNPVPIPPRSPRVADYGAEGGNPSPPAPIVVVGHPPVQSIYCNCDKCKRVEVHHF